MTGNIKNNRNVILLICTLTVALFLILKFRSHSKNNTITVLFDNVPNLSEGAPVTMKGLLIGNVNDLKLLNNNKIAADILLTRTINIPVNSIFRLQQPVIGSACIAIEPGDQTTYIALRDTIAGFVSNEKLLDKLLSDTAIRNKLMQTLDTITAAANNMNRLPADTFSY